ncbi:MAG: hypothetical protein PHD07_06795 [Bacteroidales bacterium]|nr:hypothetical protein [Bacteroidales bacterium]
MMTLLSAFLLLSCSKNKNTQRQADSILSLSYSDQGMEAYGHSYFVERCSDGATIIIGEGTPDEMVFKTDTGIFNDLQVVIDKYRMYKYKKRYKQHLSVMDGNSWSFNVRYSNAELEINTRGENAWPKDGSIAFSEIVECFEKAVRKEGKTLNVN